eukprot:TRINITY_DN43197_c0_g1_i1.p1 TRINITY_DN43197_c0_g1~~TRINITY_DN43197_c0_g1_i1.p1  ORF type:complete len:123 (+),score=17.68 TRINITY_DN43197_c0_g1_i1:1027-1395(+)
MLKEMMGMAHRQASSTLITEFIMDRVKQNANLKLKEIMNDYQMEFGATISYRKAYIEREMAMNMICGSYGESFQQLPAGCNKHRHHNGGPFEKIFLGIRTLFKVFHVFIETSDSCRRFTSTT